MTRNSSKKREERKPDTRPEKSRDREQFPDNRAMLFYFLRGSKAFFACSILFAALSSVFAIGRQTSGVKQIAVNNATYVI